jgi:hypothetical protein
VRSAVLTIALLGGGCFNEYHPDYHPETIVNYGTLVLVGAQAPQPQSPVPTPAPTVVSPTLPASLDSCAEYLRHATRCIATVTPPDSPGRARAEQSLASARKRFGRIAARGNEAEVREADEACTAAVRAYDVTSCGGG